MVNFDSVRAKIEQSKEHKCSLFSAIDDFIQSGSIQVAGRINKEKCPVYYLDKCEQPPTRIGLIAGDLFHNLRSALDHLAWQLVLANGAEPGSHTYFPIAGSEKEYNQSFPRKLEGMSDSAIKEINALKPYKGGSNFLWELNKLDNKDKHRVLVTAVSSYVGFDVGYDLQKQWQESVGDEFEVPEFLPMILRPAEQLSPSVAGEELFIGRKGDTVDPKQSFEFTVSLREPDLDMDKDLKTLASEHIKKVELVVDKLSKFVSGSP